MRRSTDRFWLGMAPYSVVLIWSVRFLKKHPESEWRIPIALAPVAPIAFVWRTAFTNW